MLTQDVTQAARSLRRSPGFLAVAVLCLALALGLCTTTFAILDAVVHPYVPFASTDRLFQVLQWGRGAGEHITSFDKYAALRDHARFYDGIGLYSAHLGMIESSSANEQRLVTSVSTNLFPLLGVRPVAGRSFGPSIDDDGAAVISYALWQRLFPRRTLEDQATISIDDRAYSVIGVMPPEMRFPWGTDVWLRLPATAALTGAGVPWVTPVVRLEPNATPETARAELALIAARLTELHGTGLRSFSYDLQSVRPDPLRLREIHGAIAGAALAILLIACANLANLLLARGIVTRRDLAVRRALGATRGALLRQRLIEGCLIAVAGGVLGLVLSAWGVDILRHRLPTEVELIGMLAPRLSWRVYLFGLAATATTVLLFALAPAIRSSNVDVTEPLKDTAGTTTPRLRSRYSTLVIAEVALSLVLVMGAALLTRAAQRVAGYDFGYDPRGLLSMGLRFASGTPGDTIARAARDMVDRIRHLEGVRDAASIGWDAPEGNIVLSDAATASAGRLWLRGIKVVSPEFLRTLGIPVIRGRDFQPGDRAGLGAVIVDRDAAERLWPGEDPVGRMVKLGDERSTRPWLPVIGVAGRASLHFEWDPDLAPEPSIYVLRAGDGSPWLSLVVRVSGEQAKSAVVLRREVEAVLPSVSVTAVTSWLRGFEQLVAARRLVAAVFALCGAFALFLTAVGLYGVLAYATSRRMREFGVRIALGARPRDLLGAVFHDGFVMVLAGTGVGALFAMWAAQILGSWLYNVNPTDAVALIAAEAMLMAVSIIACMAPAVHATRADPLEILRAT